MTPTNMREVVDRLRAEGSEAVHELAEFDHALAALLQNVEQMAPALQDLHLVASKVVELRNGEALTWNAVRDQTVRLNVWIQQFLAAFRQVQSAVQGWNIARASRGSVPPTGGNEASEQ